MYCKRIQFQIQDLLDTRAKGWQNTTFKDTAKTKEDIRKAESIKDGEMVRMGVRPSFLSTSASAGGGDKSSDGNWETVPKGHK